MQRHNLSNENALKLLLIILLVALLSLLGCSKSNPVIPEYEPVIFEDLTEPNDIIHNLILSYKDTNIEEYSKLLLAASDSCSGKPYSSEYIWYNQPGVCCLDEYLLREDDICVTNNIFLAAKGMPASSQHYVIDKLTLSITDGGWSPVDSLFGEECGDCWFTEREYELELRLGMNTLFAYDSIHLYIVPVDEGGLKIYKIAIAKDVSAYLH